MKNRIPFLPNWALLNRSYAFKDTDSATAIEQTAKIYRAMQDLIEDYNKFVEDLNKSFEEYTTLTDQDQECFKTHIDKICHDYIELMDMKSDEQYKMVDDAINFMKENLGESISTTIAVMRESGELNNVILAGLGNIQSMLESQQTQVETNTTSIDSINTTLSTLNGGLVNLENKLGSLDDLPVVETSGDNDSVVAGINAVHRILSTSLESINENIESANEIISEVQTNLGNLTSNVYVKDNYAVLEGDFTSSFYTPQYPVGFTMDNCVVLSCAIKYSGEDTMYQYLSQFDDDDTANNKSFKFCYAQVSSGVYITNTYKIENDYSCHYKIVLLKYKD